MRRFVLFLTALMLCLLCGCGGEKTITELTESYRSGELTGTVQLEYGGLTVQAELCVCGNSAAICVTAPTELAGMRIVRTDGQVTLEYMGMSVPFGDMKRLPMAQLLAVFDELAKCEEMSLTVKKEEGGYSVSCGGDFPFTAHLDENGMLKSAVYTAREQKINAMFDMAVTENQSF